MTYPKRGEVYWGPGKEEIRPLVIISNDIGNQYSEDVIVMAGTSKNIDKVYPVEVLITKGLKKPTKFQADALFTIRKHELGEQITTLSQENISRINNAIRIELDI